MGERRARHMPRRLLPFVDPARGHGRVPLHSRRSAVLNLQRQPFLFRSGDSADGGAPPVRARA
eukprot:3677325-Prymnesium_polylepis.1